MSAKITKDLDQKLDAQLNKTTTEAMSKISEELDANAQTVMDKRLASMNSDTDAEFNRRQDR